MEEKQKIFIRGRREHGTEIQHILKEYGATDTRGMTCENEDAIYFIDHKNKISSEYTISEAALVIMDNYKEIRLLEKPWKDGDILISNNNHYAMFKKYKDNDYFEAYFLLDKKQVIFDMTVSIGSYHLPNKEERDQILEMIRPMFRMIASILFYKN